MPQLPRLPQLPQLPTLRIALGVMAIGLIAVGAHSAVDELRPEQLVSLALWLAGAIVVHDGILAPATNLLSALLERVGSPLVPTSRAVIRVGFVVAAVLTLVAAPAVVAALQGSANPTVLPASYAVRLGWSLVAIGLTTAIGVVAAQRRAHVPNA